ncbi:MAG: hypothetical protein ACOC06_04225 [Halorubrum sp.]
MAAVQAFREYSLWILWIFTVCIGVGVGFIRGWNANNAFRSENRPEVSSVPPVPEDVATAVLWLIVALVVTGVLRAIAERRES